MIKAVIFDLDGTLADTLGDLTAAVNFALHKYGYPAHGTAELKNFVGDGVRKLLMRSLPPEKRSPGDVELLLPHFLEYYGENYLERTIVYGGMPELVGELKRRGMRLAVISNKVHHMTVKVVEMLYPGMFEVVLGQQDGLPAKPDPYFLNESVKILDVKKEECVFVGDSGVDMQTALNGGVTPVGVLWGFRGRDELEQAGAWQIAGSPEELLELIILE